MKKKLISLALAGAFLGCHTMGMFKLKKVLEIKSTL